MGDSGFSILLLNNSKLLKFIWIHLEEPVLSFCTSSASFGKSFLSLLLLTLGLNLQVKTNVVPKCFSFSLSATRFLDLQGDLDLLSHSVMWETKTLMICNAEMESMSARATLLAWKISRKNN